jgi:hypothetical protein
MAPLHFVFSKVLSLLHVPRFCDKTEDLQMHNTTCRVPNKTSSGTRHVMSRAGRELLLQGQRQVRAGKMYTKQPGNYARAPCELGGLNGNGAGHVYSCSIQQWL